MAFIMDAHVLIWVANDPHNLPSRVLSILNNPENSVYISIASLWELRIQQSIGRLILPKNFFHLLHLSGYKILHITVDHLEKLLDLPLLHRDPFDRIIIAQALAEEFILISKDAMIQQYNVSTVF